MNARIVRIAAVEDGCPRGVVVGLPRFWRCFPPRAASCPIALSMIGLSGAVALAALASPPFVVAASSPVWEEAVERYAMRDKLLRVGVVGSAVAALCCFTPVLVWLLAALGLSAYGGYLDLILLPALLVFLAITGYAIWRRKSHR